MDDAENIFETFNEIIRKVFFELDAEFHEKHNKVSFTCGATMNMVVLLGKIGLNIILNFFKLIDYESKI